MWQDVVTFGSVHYQQRFRRTEFCWAFSFYLVLLNLYWAAVPGMTSNEFHTCSNTCSLAAIFSANPVFVNRIAEPWKYERRLIYKIADLFESGNCLVYNKMTQHVEDKIIIKEYQSPVGYDGRKFYIGEIEIFKTMDRIY